jgi:predicted dehydrogenase
VAREFGIPARAATRLEDVVGLIDGAVVATPNDTHHPIALQCIRAGIAVLVEKPLCATLAAATELVEEARKAHVVLATGYSTRFRDNVAFLKELLDADEFGAVRRFAHQFGSAGGWAPLSAYTLQRRTAGGGVLVVTGTHFLDRMLHFWGEPDECFLEDDGIGGPESQAVATFCFNRRGGLIEGIARYSKAASLPSGLVLETTQGIVKLRDSDDAEIEFFPRANPRVTLRVRRRGPPRFNPAVSPFQHQLEDFARAVQESRPPMVNGEQGLASMRLLERLYAGRRTTVPRWYPA